MPYETSVVRQARAKAARYAMPKGAVPMNDSPVRQGDDPREEMRANAIFMEDTGFTHSFAQVGAFSTQP